MNFDYYYFKSQNEITDISRLAELQYLTELKKV